MTASCKCPTLRRIDWDPMKGPPPRYDGTWEYCVVNVRNWATLAQAYVHLTQSPHDFRSVIVDSITEAQRKLKTQLRGMDAMRIQDWNDILIQMDKWVRDMRDLILIPGSPVQLVMFVAETKFIEGKWRPSMQGQIWNALPYWVDLCGYLFVGRENDDQGQPTIKVRQMLIMSDHPQFESGERVQGVLGDVVREPNITNMMTTIFGDQTTPEGGENL